MNIGDGRCSFIDAYRWASGSSPSAWSKGHQPSAAVLHSLRELGELTQWLPVVVLHHKHSPGIIIIVVVIITWPLFLFHWTTLSGRTREHHIQAWYYDLPLHAPRYLTTLAISPRYLKLPFSYNCIPQTNTTLSYLVVDETHNFNFANPAVWNSPTWLTQEIWHVFKDSPVSSLLMWPAHLRFP